MSDPMDFYGPKKEPRPVFEGLCSQIMWMARIDWSNEYASGVCENDLHTLFWHIDRACDPSAADIFVRQLDGEILEESDGEVYRFRDLVEKAPLELDEYEEEPDEFYG